MVVIGQPGYQYVNPDKGKIHERLSIANQLPTLAERLAAAGLSNYSVDDVSAICVLTILGDAIDAHDFDTDTLETLHGALNGLPDKSSVPSKAWGLLAVMTPVVPPVGLAGIYLYLSAGKPTIQTITKSTKELDYALGEIGSFDAAAADILANAILANQASYGDEYMANLTGNFAKWAWRGAVAAVTVPIKAAADLTSQAVGSLFSGVTSGLGSSMSGWAWTLAIVGGLGWGAYKLGFFSAAKRRVDRMG